MLNRLILNGIRITEGIRIMEGIRIADGLGETVLVITIGSENGESSSYI
jgi:hypothetical protein